MAGAEAPAISHLHRAGEPGEAPLGRGLACPILRTGQRAGRRNRPTARAPILRPCSSPSSTALREWNPIRMRDSAFSSAAWEKLPYLRVTGAGPVQVLPVASVR